MRFRFTVRSEASEAGGYQTLSVNAPSGNFYSNGRLPITSLSARGATGSVSGSGAGESGETPSGESGAPYAALGLEPCASAQRVPPSAMQSTESPMLTSYIRIDDGLPSGPRAEREGLAAPRRVLREVSNPSHSSLVHSLPSHAANGISPSCRSKLSCTNCFS